MFIEKMMVMHENRRISSTSHYVKQGEYCVIKSGENVSSIHTNKVTTCTIVVLKNEDSGAVLFMHVDTATRAWRSRTQLSDFLATGRPTDRYLLMFEGGGHERVQSISLSRIVRAIIKSYLQRALPNALRITQDGFKSYTKMQPPMYDMKAGVVSADTGGGSKIKKSRAHVLRIILATALLLILLTVLHQQEFIDIAPFMSLAGGKYILTMAALLIFALYIGNPWGRMRPAAFMQSNFD